jgi:hypothetical protein
LKASLGYIVRPYGKRKKGRGGEGSQGREGKGREAIPMSHHSPSSPSPSPLHHPSAFCPCGFACSEFLYECSLTTYDLCDQILNDSHSLGLSSNVTSSGEQSWSAQSPTHQPTALGNIPRGPDHSFVHGKVSNPSTKGKLRKAINRFHSL